MIAVMRVVGAMLHAQHELMRVRTDKGARQCMLTYMYFTGMDRDKKEDCRGI